MARWLVGWTLFISLATAGAYFGTNALVAGPAAEQASLAMQPLAMQPLADGGPGTSACRRAQGALLDAAAGADPAAPAEVKAVWDGAARAVLQACADA